MATQRKIVASPAYLARMGTPETAADLASHNCLGFNLHRSSPVWPIKDNGRLVEQSLTGTIHAADGEDVRDLTALLAPRVGRLLFGGWPTGVSVTWSQHHGGPWPATTAPAYTSVGTAAIRRWLIPVAYQDFPPELLPAGLAGR